jgi:chaperonin GroEL (HSP60 family)
MGSLVSASVINLNDKAMLLLEGKYISTAHTRSWPVATLVLAARNEHAYLELVHVATSCFKRLEALMEAPEALAGAGCAEIHMAAWLRRHADHLVVSDRPASGLYAGDRSVLRKLRTVVRAFADALESAVVALDHGVHGLADEVVQKMRDANRETLDELPETSSYELYGWDALRGDPVRVASVKQRGHSESDSTSSDEEEAEAEEDDSRELVSAWVLDSLAVKRDAVTTAVECATALLRVAGVITTSPC